MKAWKKNAVAAAVLVTVCAGIYVNWLYTEEQTVAHRYVQMGAIQASEELTHPENMNLTQYLGKMPQEGPVNADKKVHLKLQDDDELFLMGVGLSRKLPSQMRNSIIAKPLSTEVKSKEIINAAVSYGLKAGLTLIDIKVESTFLLPGDAVINNNLIRSGSAVLCYGDVRNKPVPITVKGKLCRVVAL